jgi:mannose-6-phosphate isomerase-like protein (cupin superfamily)
MAEFSEHLLKLMMGGGDSAAAPAPSNEKPDPQEVHHATRPVLMERIAYLRKMAKFDEGSASEVLHEYPQHNVQLSVRLRSGIAELHENFADLFFILDGKATLLSGGTVVKPKIVSPGETRGESLAGANQRELRPGDIAHIPAGTPHQIALSGDATFAALVVKIQEK